jgi:hypothetical protein
MSDRVQRWGQIGVGAAVIALVGWVTWAEAEHHGKAPRADLDGGGGTQAAAGGTSTSAGASATGVTTTDAGSAAIVMPDLDGGLGLFLDASSIALPSGAPRSVHIGVVLVQFQGAEGASSNARNKKEALAFAEKLREDAKADWKKAVRDGDGGSSEDIGRLPRGVLDPRSEVTVFSLGAGEISEPLETPKGYWVVKRLE